MVLATRAHHVVIGVAVVMSVTACNAVWDDFGYSPSTSAGGAGGSGAGVGVGASGAGAESCDGVGTEPVLITDEGFLPPDLAVDATHVYFTSNSGSPTCGEKIFKHAKDGSGERETIGNTTFISWYIAVVDDAVIWSTRDSTEEQIYSCDRNGRCDTCNIIGRPAEPLTGLVTGRIEGMFTDASNVYFVSGNTYELRKCPLSGCGALPPAMPTTVARFVGHHEANVFWFDFDGLWTCDAGADCVEATALMPMPMGLVEHIAVNSDHVYWCDGVGVSRCARSGCDSGELVASVEGCDGIVVDDSGVYFSAPAAAGEVPSIHRCPLADCAAPTVLAEAANAGEHTLTVDACAVYWASDNSVWRVGK